jgi:hypothetical protein
MNDYCLALRFFLLAFSVVAVAGCGTRSRWVSQLATTKGPIAVETTVDGPSEITVPTAGNVPNVTLHFGGDRRVVVQQDRILVDDEVYATVPAGAQKVEIDVAGGKVTLKADGQMLTR